MGVFKGSKARLKKHPQTEESVRPERYLLKERLRKRMLCCRPGGSLVRPLEEQSTTRCPRLQMHTGGQMESTKRPSSPNSSSRSRQSCEAERVAMVWTLKEQREDGIR